MQTAQFELEQARAGLLQTRQAAGDRSLYSPVAASCCAACRKARRRAAGKPLLEIGDLRDLEIVRDLLSTDAVRSGRAAAC